MALYPYRYYNSLKSNDTFLYGPIMNHKLVAPCGMNCNICYAHLREKKKCSGCRGNAGEIFTYCAKCTIRNCNYLKTSGKKYCYSCPDYPCRRLKQLDKRYRTKYRMSMIENLENIKKRGIRKFVAKEKERWKCKHCGAVTSCHHTNCRTCGDEL